MASSSSTARATACARPRTTATSKCSSTGSSNPRETLASTFAAAASTRSGIPPSRRRTRHRLGRTVQQPEESLASHGLGRQADRRVEHIPHQDGRRQSHRLAERQTGRRTTSCSKTTGSATSRSTRRADRAAEPRQHAVLQEHLPEEARLVSSLPALPDGLGDCLPHVGDAFPRTRSRALSRAGTFVSVNCAAERTCPSSSQEIGVDTGQAILARGGVGRDPSPRARCGDSRDKSSRPARPSTCSS